MTQNLKFESGQIVITEFGIGQINRNFISSIEVILEDGNPIIIDYNQVLDILEEAYEKSKKLVLADGKYTIVFDKTNSIPKKCLRYKEEWRCLIGDKLIYCLVAKIEELQEEIEKFKDMKQDNYIFLP